MSVVELKNLLRAHKLPTTGRKIVLVERARANNLTPHQAPRAQSPVRARSPVRAQSPVRARSPVRVQSPARARSPVRAQSSAQSPSRTGTSAGPTLERRRDDLYEFIVKDFPDQNALQDLDAYIYDHLDPDWGEEGQFRANQLAQVRALGSALLAAAEQLMGAIQSGRVNMPATEDSRHERPRRVLGFVIINGQFYLRQNELHRPGGL